MSDAKIRLARRQRGFSDGVAGRPARSLDVDYQQSWRRGVARRLELAQSVSSEAAKVASR